MHVPPEVAPSKLVNSLKGVSSRRLRQEYPQLVPHYWRAQRLWSGSYLAGSVGGAPLSIVKQYIEQQNRPVRAELDSADPCAQRESEHFPQSRHHRAKARCTAIEPGSAPTATRAAAAAASQGGAASSTAQSTARRLDRVPSRLRPGGAPSLPPAFLGFGAWSAASTIAADLPCGRWPLGTRGLGPVGPRSPPAAHGAGRSPPRAEGGRGTRPPAPGHTTFPPPHESGGPGRDERPFAPAFRARRECRTAGRPGPLPPVTEPVHRQSSGVRRDASPATGPGPPRRSSAHAYGAHHFPTFRGAPCPFTSTPRPGA
ncbi:hypothetical protein FHS42_005506 [Streptomyces zagrosensis]|uniref:Transposase IS200-like domain-containing protein n=1 Tax=Streptomyces zagrosensis TaxID=1042984 RepID=A0A7W9V104_9ACTN|nr:hypothetical protein [Streptomyces zagrosensis]